MAVFERYHSVIATAFTRIYTTVGYKIGPRVAAMTLREVAQEREVWDGAEGVKHGLVDEMHRLTNVLALTDQGWRPVPWDAALKAGYMDEEDASVVDNALTFFSVAYRMHRKSERGGILSSAAEFWGGQTTSLDCTAFVASLTTLTAPGTSRPPAAPTAPTDKIVTHQGSPIPS